jgi:hypothetical protein
VAAGRAGPADRHARPRGARPGAATRPPPVSAIARNVVRWRLATLAPATGRSPRRSRCWATARSRTSWRPSPASRSAELAPPATRWLAAGLLDPDGERLAHGLVAAAIEEDLTGTECERMHREAARALMAGPPTPTSSPATCSSAARGPIPDVSGCWCRPRRRRRAAGRRTPPRPTSSARCSSTRRATTAGACSRQLATVAFDAGLPDSQRRLLDALPEVRDRESRIDLLTRLAALNVLGPGDADHAELFERELARQTDPEARAGVEAASLDALLMIPARNLERGASGGGRSTSRRRRIPCSSACSSPTAHGSAIELGTPDARTCAALALEALDGDLLLREAGRRAAYHLCVRTLVLTDRPAEAQRAIAAMRDEATARGSLRLRAGASWYASNLALRSGQVAEAENHARLALDLVDDAVNTFTGGAIMLLLYALIERGEFDEARELLGRQRLDDGLRSTRWEIGLRHARARLWLARGRLRRRACRGGRGGRAARAARAATTRRWTPWRSTAAVALAHLGRREEAAVLADAEVAWPSASAPRCRSPTRCTRAPCRGAGRRARGAVRARLGVIADVPAVLQRVRLRLELGAAPGPIGRRLEARAALRPALADADAVGAVLLAQRAGASSRRPGCARARRRSRASRR